MIGNKQQEIIRMKAWRLKKYGYKPVVIAGVCVECGQDGGGFFNGERLCKDCFEAKRYKARREEQKEKVKLRNKEAQRRVHTGRQLSRLDIAELKKRISELEYE